MPYSLPDMSNGVSPRIRNHRRSHSSSAQFSDEKGPGAFVSLGALPKLQRKPTTKKSPTFHFRDDDDEEEESSSQDEKDLTRLSIDTTNLRSSTAPITMGGRYSPPKVASRDTIAETSNVPFPVSSPLSPSPTDTPSLVASPGETFRRPTLSRGSSHPILLSNGKPLKSSLKSSASASSIPEELRGGLHLRVQSVPTTPFLSKSVHFPEKKEDGLECVKVFNHKARPANISTGGEDTETETEREDRFPFPRFDGAGPLLSRTGTALTTYEIDTETASTVPSPDPPSYQNIHFESITLNQPATPSSPLAPITPHLTGTILVRNVAYEKHVAVRFTLDDWQTTSEVRAKHVVSVLSLPWEVSKTKTLGDAVGLIANSSGTSALPTWDRFSFTIRLEDHAYKLQDKTLWLVGRYSTGEGGNEWWDNNSGKNYKVAFKVVPAKGREETGRTLSAPEPTIKSAVPTFGIGFEFPTSTIAHPIANSKSATSEIAASSPTPYTPPQQRTVQPPPPPPVRDVPRSTKLSLKNYAAPSLSPTISPVASRASLNISPSLSTATVANPFTTTEVRATPLMSPAEEIPVPYSAGWESNDVTPKATGNLGPNSNKMQTIIGGQPASTPFEPQFSNIALHWSWGLSQNSSGPLAPGQRRSPSGSGSNSPYSPKVMSPLGSNTPANSNHGSPQTNSGRTSPRGCLDPNASDQLYDAMVKNWCFAQSPGPGPGSNQPTGFPSSEGFFGGVLVS